MRNKIILVQDSLGQNRYKVIQNQQSKDELTDTLNSTNLVYIYKNAIYSDNNDSDLKNRRNLFKIFLELLIDEEYKKCPDKSFFESLSLDKLALIDGFTTLLEQHNFSILSDFNELNTKLVNMYYCRKAMLDFAQTVTSQIIKNTKSFWKDYECEITIDAIDLEDNNGKFVVHKTTVTLNNNGVIKKIEIKPTVYEGDICGTKLSYYNFVINVDGNYTNTFGLLTDIYSIQNKHNVFDVFFDDKNKIDEIFNKFSNDVLLTLVK